MSKFSVSVSEDAENDIDGAFIWYELQRKNLGLQFIKKVDEGFRKIKRNPELFPRVLREIRRHIIRKFPFCLYYFIKRESEEIVVVAVFHNSRNPFVWKKRK